MGRSTLRLFLSILLPIALFSGAVTAREVIKPPAIVEAGFADARLPGNRGPVSYSRTAFGPLVSLAPIVAALGGNLDVGPLRQRHELTIGEESFLFGPGASAVTVGQEIDDLSQPPQKGPEGLQVPLDLLEMIYGRLLGYDFRWRPTGPQLEVSRRPARTIPLVFDIVNLQGVTTLVFQFPSPPRYRIERSPSRLEVEMIGDRLELGSKRLFPADDLVRDVRLTPEKILIDLAPGTVAQDYELEQPFRLVFDVLRDTGSGRRTAANVPRRSPRRASSIRTIVLDPGHGGTDPGARGPGGTEEKTLTLALARSLKQRLEQRLPVRVVLTRTGDSLLPHDTRSALANQHKADLFISVHINSSPAAGASGAETYFASLEASDERAAEAATAANHGDPLYDLQLILWDLAQSRHLAESQRFASLIQAELNDTLNLKNRGVKQAPFRVLMGAAMPAVLVELGFLSNPREESRLGDPEYRARLVDALARAVGRYKAQIEGVPATSQDTTGR